MPRPNTPSSDLLGQTLHLSRLEDDRLELPSQDAERYGPPTQIGEGGMGVVLRLVDRNLGREVVMKRIRGGVREGALRRFVREAQITAQLSHPGIVPVHELDAGPDGEPYFTMKLVQGDTLAQLLQQLRGDPRLAAEWTLFRRLQLFRGICQAVAFAHSRGVLHRDLKPANIMLGDYGEALVMDWGLAKVVGEEIDGLADVSTTLAGSVVGTPHYMAPEQAGGRVGEMGPHTDVFSLGLILLELIALRPAYPRLPPLAVLSMAMDGELLALGSAKDDPPVEPELAAICSAALHTEIAGRYPDVPAMIEDLDAYLAGRSVSVLDESLARRAVKWIRRNRGVAAVVAALVIGLAIADVAQTSGRRAEVARHAAQARQALEDGRPRAALRIIDRARARAPRDAGLRRWRARVVDHLVGALDRLEDRVEALPPPRMPGDARGAWYREQTRLHATARELARLTGDPRPRQLAARTARRLSRQLRLDGDAEMSALMLEQAEADGLETAALASERAMARREARETSRAHEARLEALLAASEGRGVRVDPAFAARALAAARAAEASEPARARLVRVLWRGSDGRRRFAAAALARCTSSDTVLGAAAGTPEAFESRARSAEDAPRTALARQLSAAVFRHYVGQWRGGGEGEGELTVRQHLVLAALHAAGLDGHSAADRAGLAAALVRVDDDASRCALAALAWRDGPRGPAWEKARARPAVAPSGLAPRWRAMLSMPGDADATAGALRASGRGPESLLLRGWHALLSGADAAAGRAARDLAALDGWDGAAARLDAWLAVRAGRGVRARQAIAHAVDRRPRSHGLRVDQAAIARRTGQPAEAVRVSSIGPRSLLLDAELARALIAAGHATGVFGQVDAVVAAAPGWSEARRIRADALAGFGAWRRVFEELELAQRLAPDAGVFERMCALLPRVSNTSQALALGRRLARRLPPGPSPERALLLQAYGQLVLRDDCLGGQAHRMPMFDALGDTRWRGDEPGLAEARLARDLWLGQYDRALPIARTLLARERTALRSCLLVRALRGKGRLEEALAAVDAGLSVHPHEARLLALRARLLDRLGRAKACLEACDRALARDPWMLGTRLLRGERRLAAGNAAGAAEDLALVVTIGTALRRDVDLLGRIADAWLASERLGPLRTTLGGLLALEPGHVGGRLVRAQLRIRERDLAGARRDLDALAPRAGALSSQQRALYDQLRQQAGK